MAYEVIYDERFQMYCVRDEDTRTIRLDSLTGSLGAARDKAVLMTNCPVVGSIKSKRGKEGRRLK